jgi:lipoprotein-releasing system permease protein
MEFAWRIAIRFLTEGRLQTALVIVGVAFGVAVVTYITALVTGLQENTIRRTLGVQPHISIRPVKDVPLAARIDRADAVALTEQARAQRTRSIDNWPPLVPMLEGIAGVTAVSPMASGAALAQRGEGNRAISLIGVELARYDRIAALSDKIIAGRFQLAPGEAIIGRELAEDLGVQLGDRFTVTLGRSTTESLRAVAFYDVGVREVNRRNVYVALRSAQSLLGIPGGITSLDITLSDVFEADRTAAALAARLPYEIESWMQTNSQLLSALFAQTLSTRLIRLVVMLVVVLGIASVLAVSVVQKRKEIGILRAMGASRGQITRVFLLQGALVGAAGSILGAGLAWLMIALFTALVKGADGKPLFAIVLEWGVVLNIGLAATMCGVLAAAAPARRAARLDPAEAIRL